VSAPLTIALDAMGGDFGPSVVVPAALDFLGERRDLALILVGNEGAIREQLQGAASDERVTIRHASQIVAMDESPSRALRNKKDSSMRVAIELVKDGVAQACVSAGNTGALMATARFVLKTLPGVDRPAIITAVPSQHGSTHLLDLGANVDCSAIHLFQFAVMGSELITAVEGVTAPKVGLLNIGEEEIKGNEQVKQAHELLVASDLNYVGYVEGDDIYLGDVDLVVMDGFVGNVALKTSEGLAKLLGRLLSRSFKQNWLTRISGLAALPIINRFRRTYDPRQYNGASLLGLRGIVIKSHGGADRLSFKNAIRIAEKEIHSNVPERIAQQVAVHLDQERRRAAG
jgi:glycerol-3-phosphate acyltransferase PlsX